MELNRGILWSLAGIWLAASSFTGCRLETLKSPFRSNLNKLSGHSLGSDLIVATGSSDSLVASELREFKSFSFDINLDDVQGHPLRLANYRGKVVLVDLWGTWCGPCRRVIPHLVSLQTKYPVDLQVIGLCNERTADSRAATNQLTHAMQELGINYPCALIDDQTLRKVPNFSGYPTMLFLDRAGRVRMATVGVKSDEYFDTILNQLMAEPDPTSEAAAHTASTRKQQSQAGAP